LTLCLCAHKKYPIQCYPTREPRIFFSCSQASSCEWRLDWLVYDYNTLPTGVSGLDLLEPRLGRLHPTGRGPRGGALVRVPFLPRTQTHSFRFSTPESRGSRTGDDRGVEQNGNQRSNGPWRASGRRCAARRRSSRCPRPALRTGCCRRSPSIVVKTHAFACVLAALSIVQPLELLEGW
jgi:hypothetical protein